MKRSNNNFSAILLLIGVLGTFVTLLLYNANQAQPVAPILPTDSLPTEQPDSISALLDRNFGNNSSPQPTIAIPQIQPTRPVIAQPLQATLTPVSAGDVAGGSQSVAVLAATPTFPPPTGVVPAAVLTRDPADWSPPPLEPPISRDPLGRDHYWFRRPIQSNANNTRVLLSYAYGSDNINDDWRIHHGIDIPNPVGEVVYATGSGVVLFASDGRSGEIDVFQNTTSYGNVVFIEHDFGFGGQPLYTLYAHLQASLVREGDFVQAGDPIALVGATGYVSGPHLHYEVRFGGQTYGDTYNPTLWMVPFVGHGVIAGRVVDANGEFIDDVPVTIRSAGAGTYASVTTYVFAGTIDDVNSDPNWRENFVVGDIPVGRWDVVASIDGQRVVRQVEVFEGTTTQVELRLNDPITESPAESTEASGG